MLLSKTNKDITTEIFPPLFFKPTDICARAMPGAKKGQQKVPILKKTTGLCPSRSYYSIENKISYVMFCDSGWGGAGPGSSRQGHALVSHAVIL